MSRIPVDKWDEKGASDQCSLCPQSYENLIQISDPSAGQIWIFVTSSVISTTELFDFHSFNDNALLDGSHFLPGRIPALSDDTSSLVH